jgi:hypothetical protein
MTHFNALEHAMGLCDSKEEKMNQLVVRYLQYQWEAFKSEELARRLMQNEPDTAV